MQLSAMHFEEASEAHDRYMTVTPLDGGNLLVRSANLKLITPSVKTRQINIYSDDILMMVDHQNQ